MTRARSPRRSASTRRAERNRAWPRWIRLIPVVLLLFPAPTSARQGAGGFVLNVVDLKAGAGVSKRLTWKFTPEKAAADAVFTFTVHRFGPAPHGDVVVIQVDAKAGTTSVDVTNLPKGNMNFRVDCSAAPAQSNEVTVVNPTAAVAAGFDSFDTNPPGGDASAVETRKIAPWNNSDAKTSTLVGTWNFDPTKNLGVLTHLNGRPTPDANLLPADVTGFGTPAKPPTEIRAKVRVDRWTIKPPSPTVQTTTVLDAAKNTKTETTVTIDTNPALGGVGVALEFTGKSPVTAPYQYHALQIYQEAKNSVLKAAISFVSVDAAGKATTVQFDAQALPPGFVVPTGNAPRPWVWLSLSRSGNNLTGRVWLDGQDEPKTSDASNNTDTAKPLFLVLNAPGLLPLSPASPALLGGQAADGDNRTGASFDEVTLLPTPAGAATTSTTFDATPDLFRSNAAFRLALSAPTQSSRKPFDRLPEIRPLEDGTPVRFDPETLISAWEIRTVSEKTSPARLVRENRRVEMSNKILESRRPTNNAAKTGQNARESDRSKNLKPQVDQKKNTSQEQFDEAEKASEAIRLAKESWLEWAHEEAAAPALRSFFFDQQARFPLRSFDSCGDTLQDRTGALIHGGAQLIASADGRYEMIFVVTSAPTGATLDLTLELVDEIQTPGAERRITLPPIRLLDDDAVREGSRKTWIVRVPGYSHAFDERLPNGQGRRAACYCVHECSCDKVESDSMPSRRVASVKLHGRATFGVKPPELRSIAAGMGTYFD